MSFGVSNTRELILEAKRSDRELKYAKEFYTALGHYLNVVGEFYKFSRSTLNDIGPKNVDDYVLAIFEVFSKKIKALARDYKVLKEIVKSEKLGSKKKNKIKTILRNFFLYYEPSYFEFWAKRLIRVLKEASKNNLKFSDRIAIKSIIQTGENAAQKAEKLWHAINQGS